MFDLEHSIAEWRRQMIAAGIKAPVPLEELENHLREDLERQMQHGAGAERAFRQAVENIGSGEKVQREFAKVQEIKRLRNRRVLRRWSAIAGVGFVYSMVAAVWIIGVRQGTWEITGREIALALGAIIPMIGFGWAGNALAKYLPGKNTGVGLIGAFGVIILSAELLRLFWNALTPANLVQTQIILLWSLSPLLGVGNFLSAWVDNSKRREMGISN